MLPSDVNGPYPIKRKVVKKQRRREKEMSCEKREILEKEDILEWVTRFYVCPMLGMKTPNEITG